MDLRFKFRPATPEEVPIFGFWSRVQGWNRGVDDEKYIHMGAPTGLWLAVTDLLDSERPDPVGGPYDSDPTINTRPIVAIVVRTEHSDSYAFMGSLIVRPEWRSQKVATALVLTCVNSVPKIIGFNAVSNMVPAYQRAGGFIPYFKVIQFSGSIKPSLEGPENESVSIAANVASPYKIVAAKDVPLDSILAFDLETFGCTVPTRRDFMTAWISRTQLGSAALCLVDQNEKVTGLVVSRPGYKGIIIGPLVAPDLLQAELLLRTLNHILNEALGHNPEYFIDAPDMNPESVPLYTKLGFVEVFSFARMFHFTKDQGEPPVMPNTVFAVVSPTAGP